MKKLLITIVTALCMAQGAVAVPADPRPKVVTQADGQQLTIVLRGDERGHLTMTVDGYPLFFNTLTGNYEYAALSADGSLTGSGIVAADESRRTAQDLEYLAVQDIEGIINAVNEQRTANSLRYTTAKVRKAATAKAKMTDFPTLGEQHSLVILVDFTDLTFSTFDGDAQTFYTAMLNEEGFTYTNGADGSARDFYVASSNGAFLPTFDVVGPVTLPESYTYYGENDSNGNDYHAGQMVVEACQLVEDDVDFADYDADGDGLVDNVYVFYAGRGEADGGGSETIWPHSATLEDWDTTYVTNEGVTVSSYSCTNEARTATTAAGIGTFVHEFGHVLGLVDHYSTTYGSAAYVHPGEWDTMAEGSYNNNCHTPPLFSAFERAELGWLDYTELSATADSIVHLPLLADYNTAYKVAVDGNDDEYYILENRQQEGWDEYLPGHGMLVWHIDYDEETWQKNTVNTNATHQRVDIVEADDKSGSTTYSGDSFPGTSYVTAYDFYSWDDVLTIGLEGIRERTIDEESVITFVVSGAVVELDSPQSMTFTDVSHEAFTVEWGSVDEAESYGVAVTLDGDTIATASTTSLAATFSGLTAETTYDVAVEAVLGANRSEALTGTVTTDVLPFTQRTPTGLAANNVTATGFTALWDEVDDADGYVVNLALQEISDETVEQGYDFSSRSTGMPDGWLCNHTTWISSSGNYGESAPALALTADGDYLFISYAQTKLSSLSFWNKASADDTGSLTVEAAREGEWSEEGTVELSTTAATSTFTFDKADSLRITFNRTANRAYIDDVVVGCNTVTYTAADDYDGLNVGNVTQTTFADLEAYATYALTVTATDGDDLSLTSDTLIVTLWDDPTSIDKIDAARTACGDGVAVYDILGRRLPDASRAHALYIIRCNGRTVKVRR